VVTDDRAAAAQELVNAVEGLTLEDALSTPFLALGKHAEIADHLQRCRARWGISYYTVRDVPAFAPVIDRLRRAEACSVRSESNEDEHAAEHRHDAEQHA